MLTAIESMPQVVVLRPYALRGAITVAEDSAEAIADAVRELLGALTAANAIESGDVLSAIFSATPDLHRLYPAAVARELGWVEVPMLCVAEMEVAEALPRCVRVLLHVMGEPGRTLRPCYLRDARALRPDLVEGR